jgi:hypothetical protein
MVERPACERPWRALTRSGKAARTRRCYSSIRLKRPSLGLRSGQAHQRRSIPGHSVKDRDGRVIGFEKLNFSVPDSDSLRVALETAPA